VPYCLNVEKAKGAAVNGPKRILEVVAEQVHARTPLIAAPAVRSVSAGESCIGSKVSGCRTSLLHFGAAGLRRNG
ncbi:MAG: hypothetical protein PW735_09735, partial [Acidobacteriaceae bacterium]|nr:hypothetical protein [Acidobacteriaceae bacterium]